MVRSVYRGPLTAVCVTLAVLGCRRHPAEDQAAIRRSLQETKTLEVMDQVARSPEFRPPAHSRLTAAQVRMYFAVRGREQKLREAMKAMGDLADTATADLRAAWELGYDVKEYRWVRDRVLEAQLLAATTALDRQVTQGRQALVRAFEAQKGRTDDEAERARLDRQIQDLQSDSGAAPKRDPAKEFNARLLAKLGAFSQEGGH